MDNDLEAENRRLRQELESVHQLAMDLAHDLNNVRGAILGYASLILDELKEGDSFAADIREIVTAAQAAEQLTDRLVALGRRLPASSSEVRSGRVDQELIGRAAGAEAIETKKTNAYS